MLKKQTTTQILILSVLQRVALKSRCLQRWVPLHDLGSNKNKQYSSIFSKIGLVTHYAIKDCLDQHFALCQKLVLLSFIAQISYLKTRCAWCIYEHKVLIAFDIRFQGRTIKFPCQKMNALKLVFQQAFKKRRKKRTASTYVQKTFLNCR